jgi:hypothetical protein
MNTLSPTLSFNSLSHSIEFAKKYPSHYAKKHYAFLHNQKTTTGGGMRYIQNPQLRTKK